ncbi:MAG: succinate dehydrogenase iron-sulfur subunit [Chloroflexota bacterium]
MAKENRTATLRIQRFNPDVDDAPYFDTFEVTYGSETTVLDALHQIKTEQDGSLTFRRSCRHGICGSCAANVNGRNILVCKTPLKETLDAERKVIIRPLSYLPIIKDLVVDREAFWDQYLNVKPWLIPPKELPEKEFLVPPDEISTYNHAEMCIMCGICYSACPVVNVEKDFIGPHAMLKAFLRVSDSRDRGKDEHMANMPTLWDCTTCYMCNALCPKELKPGATSPSLRSIWVEEGKVPRTLGVSLTSTYRNNNPFEYPREDRQLWAEGLGLRNAIEEAVDTLYFVCCLSCYDPRAQKAPQAMVKTMRKLGIQLGTLGDEEACCGSETRRIGEAGLFEMIAEERSELLASAQAKRMVTISPHCFDVYKNYYPGLELPVEHYTQFIARLIAEGKLTFKGSLRKRVTYHDPCYLGIQNKVFNEPRTILQSIPGVELIEMEQNRENSMCCGGGGGRMWFEGHGENGHASHARARQALSTGADIIATACPFCLNMLEDAVKTLGLSDKIEVKDIMELVQEAL